MDYPKRLIEVDLPIKRISAHSRREKSIRHGHISTLHIWWARRPLAACRAVICAALWPDPADENCPQAFRDAAARLITAFAEKVYNTASLHATASKESFGQWEGIVAAKAKGIELNPHDLAHLNKLRFALLDFIADFANWDNSTVKEYLETSRGLTQAAHESLGGAPGTRPLVVDPFAGGGSIPLEALRVGADAFASDLNPVAVLLNKVVLEYVPKYGQRLAEEVRKWGEWIKHEAEKELTEFYPKDADGATPIAYLWARTIQCEGPGCGAEVPLIRSLWLAKKDNRSVALQLVPRPKAKRVEFQIIVKQHDGWVDQDNLKAKTEFPRFDGTVKRGSATCPCCGYTAPAERVRNQFKGRRGGAADARLVAVVTIQPNKVGRMYRKATEDDISQAESAARRLSRLPQNNLPEEPLPYLRSIFNIHLLDAKQWRDLFTPRQSLSLSTLTRLVGLADHRIRRELDGHLADAVSSCLALTVNRQADRCSSLCRWDSAYVKVSNTFGRQALPIVWDFCEANIFSGATGDFEGALGWVCEVIQMNASLLVSGTVAQGSATRNPLPDDSAGAFITDPPYYDAVPYADLSDFFYIWLKRTLGNVHTGLFNDVLTPKREEVVQLAERNPIYSYKTRENFEKLMQQSLVEGRRVTQPSGVGVVVFAHKTTGAWETMLRAVIDAGWTITASWPIDTEMENRLRAMNSATLTSSVHLVCRPRENPDGSIRIGEVGDWRDVLGELPRRIHEWMPRLAAEGVVGADAIFACLGPALEIFSRHSRVEKSDGSVVPLREYLEHVWAAVSKEALSMIFKDADASGLEPDARLTAMWLWTVRPDPSGTNGKGSPEEVADEGQDAEDEDPQDRPIAGGGYTIEFDAARKIAQGLGANLDTLKSVVEVKGKTARLLLVSEREPFLFATRVSPQPASRPNPLTGALQATRRGKTKRPAKGQRAFGVNEEEGLSSQPALQREARSDVSPHDASTPEYTAAETVLDRIHQSMLLFARGRADALKRFLVDDGIGKDARFWKLAQSLSALYPPGTDEKRWVDGVLARKKGLGL
ncbi:MAG: DUF1156 domain-containing protein [Isosphaeraceae bacterium]